MMRRIVFGTVLLSLVGWVAHASAEVTAQGRAFGTLVSVLQLPLLTIRTGDTGPQSVTAPGSFSADGSAMTLDASPLAIVINDATSTQGEAMASPDDECTPSVNSVSGQSVASVLPDKGVIGDGLIEAVVSGSFASVTGNGAPSGDGQVVELMIAGTPIQIPSPQPPNTTILAGLNLLTLNRQVSSSDPVTGTRSMLVQALRAQLVSDGEVLDVVLSDSEASLTNLPASCFNSSCSPDLTNSIKSALFVKDEVNHGLADSGDIIKFIVSAVNSAACPAAGLQIIDRIPLFVTVDESSIKLDDQPVNFTKAACPDDAEFNCPGEQAIDTSRQCIFVDAGDLAANATKNLTYNVTVGNDLPEGSNICNAARIGNRPVVTIVEGGTGITPGDILHTTGSGGCSLNPAAPASDSWPVLVVGALLALRRWRRNRSPVSVRSST